MTIDLMKAPFPITYRELWLPAAINSNGSLPSSKYNGHPLTLTGARKGTTANGVHGTGAATSNINCGANAIDNASAKYWVVLRFKPDADWTTGAGDQYLWGKWVDATHFIRLRLDSATGALVFEKDEGGVGFTLSIPSPDGDGIWHVGTWYCALCSISNTAGARFKVNNASLQTNADISPMPNGGDLCFLDYDDPGAGTGFVGVITEIVCGNDNLTTTEEGYLYAGDIVVDAVHCYPCDEGRLGSLAYDRGSGANNGTLDTSCSWAFGQVQQPALSLDGINDHGESSVGVDLSGDWTLVYVAKMKQTYTSGNRLLYMIRRDANTFISCYLSTSTLVHYFAGGGTSIFLSLAPPLVKDNYWILIAESIVSGGWGKVFLNGSLLGSGSGAGIMAAGGAIAYIGSNSTPAAFSTHKPLLFGLINGAFTDKQGLLFSRWLKNVYNLPVSI